MIAASELFDLLKQNALITKSDIDEPTEPDSPWYIKVLMAFCGWLAAIFILGIFGLSIASLFDNSYALSVLGIFLIGCSLGVLSSKSTEFFEHLGLAGSFAGQAMIAFALFNQGESKDISNWIVLSMMFSCLAVVMPSYIHSLVSACLAALSFSYLMYLTGIPSFFSGIVFFLVTSMWLYEFTFSHKVRKLRSIAYGLVIGLMQFKTSILFAHGGQTWAQEVAPDVSPWLDEGLNVLVLIYVVLQLIRQKDLLISLPHRGIMIAVVILFCIGTFFANGIVVGLTFVLLGFVNRNRVLLVLGVICTLINLSSYYYFLDITLLNKSFIFLGLGSLSLSLMYVNKRLSSGKVL